MMGNGRNVAEGSVFSDGIMCSLENHRTRCVCLAQQGTLGVLIRVLYVHAVRTFAQSVLSMSYAIRFEHM